MYMAKNYALDEFEEKKVLVSSYHIGSECTSKGSGFEF